jgi:hypothetical protein
MYIGTIRCGKSFLENIPWYRKEKVVQNSKGHEWDEGDCAGKIEMARTGDGSLKKLCCFPMPYCHQHGSCLHGTNCPEERSKAVRWVMLLK